MKKIKLGLTVLVCVSMLAAFFAVNAEAAPSHGTDRYNYESRTSFREDSFSFAGPGWDTWQHPSREKSLFISYADEDGQQGDMICSCVPLGTESYDDYGYNDEPTYEDDFYSDEDAYDESYCDSNASGYDGEECGYGVDDDYDAEEYAEDADYEGEYGAEAYDGEDYDMTYDLSDEDEADWNNASADSSDGPSIASSWDYMRTSNDADIFVQIPEIKGLANDELESELNDQFLQAGKNMIAEFEENTTDGTQFVPSHLEYGFAVRQDDAEVLAFSVFTYTNSASADYTEQNYTINKETGELLTLADVFGDTDYMSLIKKSILKQMHERSRRDGAVYWTNEDGADGDVAVDLDEVLSNVETNHHFYLNEDGDVVITFDPYEIGPGSTGNSEFVIPVHGK